MITLVIYFILVTDVLKVCCWASQSVPRTRAALLNYIIVRIYANEKAVVIDIQQRKYVIRNIKKYKWASIRYIIQLKLLINNLSI